MSSTYSPDHLYQPDADYVSARYLVRDTRTKEAALVCQNCLLSVIMDSGRYAKYSQYANADALMPGIDACTICGFPLTPATAVTGDDAARNDSYDAQRRQGYRDALRDAPSLDRIHLETMIRALQTRLDAPADPHIHPSDYAHKLGQVTGYREYLNSH